jgi:hypothetical protein
LNDIEVGFARDIIEDMTDDWCVRDDEVETALRDLKATPLTVAFIDKECRWITGQQDKAGLH